MDDTAGMVEIVARTLAMHEGWHTRGKGWGCPCGHMVEGPPSRALAAGDVSRHKAEAIVSALQATKSEPE